MFCIFNVRLSFLRQFVRKAVSAGVEGEKITQKNQEGALASIQTNHLVKKEFKVLFHENGKK